MKHYLFLFKKWLWLIIVASVLAGVVSYVVRSSQPPSYHAQATVLVGNAVFEDNPTAGKIGPIFDLAPTYVRVAQTFDVIQAVIEELQLDLTVEEFRQERILSVSQIPETTLLVIGASYTDPITAADIANQAAEQLIFNSPTYLTSEQKNLLDLSKSQVEILSEQIDDAREQLTVVDARLASSEDQDEISRLTTQHNVIIDQINLASGNISQFNETIAELEDSINELTIIEHAQIPTRPSGISSIIIAVLGVMVGGILGVGVVLLFDYMDDTVKTSEEAAKELDLPVLGTVSRFSSQHFQHPERLIASNNGHSHILEAYRLIQTNLLHADDNDKQRMYLVTSPHEGEGKSTTAANLAMTMASSGLHVLLVDADFRRPKIHEIFDLDNSAGFTTILTNTPPEINSLEEQTIQAYFKKSRKLKAALKSIKGSNLNVITSGPSPDKPAMLLTSEVLKPWISLLQSFSNVDVVLFDTPPSLSVSDGSILAAAANADTILVVKSGKTERELALRVKEQFAHVGSDTKGVILTYANPSHLDSYLS